MIQSSCGNRWAMAAKASSNPLKFLPALSFPTNKIAGRRSLPVGGRNSSFAPSGMANTLATPRGYVSTISRRWLAETVMMASALRITHGISSR